MALKNTNTHSVSTGFELDRDDSVPGLLKELDAFIHHPDEHERVMASFDQKHGITYGHEASEIAPDKAK